MKVLVTGARGCIGSVLFERWRELGDEVVGIDNGSRGLNGGEVSPLDVVDVKAPDLVGFDGVVHLAAGTGSLDRPVELLRELNVTQALLLYHNAWTAGVKWFIYPTTSLAHGVPDSPYVFTKEEGLHALRRTDPWKGSGVNPGPRPILLPFRFCNVIGAYRGCSELRQREVHILPTLIHASLTGEPVVINGTDYATHDGTPSRDFVDVLDVVDYLRFIAEETMRLGGPPEYGLADEGVYQVASGKTYTVLDLVTLVRSYLLPGPIRVAFGPRRPFDIDSVTQPAGARFFRGWRNLQPIEYSVADEVNALLKADLWRQMFA